jgi:hypothetical protein
MPGKERNLIYEENPHAGKSRDNYTAFFIPSNFISPRYVRTSNYAVCSIKQINYRFPLRKFAISSTKVADELAFS